MTKSNNKPMIRWTWKIGRKIIRKLLKSPMQSPPSAIMLKLLNLKSNLLEVPCPRRVSIPKLITSLSQISQKINLLINRLIWCISLQLRPNGRTRSALISIYQRFRKPTRIMREMMKSLSHVVEYMMKIMNIFSHSQGSKKTNNWIKI